MRTVRFVSFEGDFSGTNDDTPEHLAGYPEVAGLLASALRAAGIEAPEPENLEDWAYDLTASHKNAEVYLIVASTDEVRPWVVSVNVSAPGLFAWVFGRYHKVMPAVLELCGVLHNALSHNPRVKCLRWYTLDTWENDQDAGWTESP